MRDQAVQLPQLARVLANKLLRPLCGGLIIGGVELLRGGNMTIVSEQKDAIVGQVAYSKPPS
jgi:hypothetical protein